MGSSNDAVAHLTGPLDFSLFRDFQGVIHLDAKVPDRRFQLGMPKEELNRPQVLGTTVDQGGLGPPQRVRAVFSGVKADRCDPLAHHP